jgi:hypothetical protein
MGDKPPDFDTSIYKTPPLSAETPAQVGSVVGVDRMDTIDRAKQDPRTKLELLALETKATTGRDPRGGGAVFVARPRIVLQLLLDLGVKSALQSEIKLHDAVVIGERAADIVGWWQGVPIIVRSTVCDDRLHCVAIDKVPQSQRVDRQRAGQLRMAAHYGKLETLREN